MNDWDDYDEPEEFEGDYSDAQLAKMGLVTYAGRRAWRVGFAAASDEKDPWVQWNSKPHNSDVTYREVQLEHMETCFAVAEQLPQLGARYYEAGLMGSQRYPGPPLDGLLEAAFIAGIKWGEREARNYEPYYRRLFAYLPNNIRMATHKGVTVEFDKYAGESDMVATDYWLEFRCKRQDLNDAIKWAVVESTAVDRVVWLNDKTLDERHMQFGGQMWSTRRRREYVPTEEVVQDYLDSESIGGTSLMPVHEYEVSALKDYLRVTKKDRFDGQKLHFTKKPMLGHLLQALGMISRVDLLT